jgi:hypothetical protein
MIKEYKVKYETAKGLEAPSLTPVSVEYANDPYYGFDFVLRGEPGGWPTRDFTIRDYELEELKSDVRDAQ